MSAPVFQELDESIYDMIDAIRKRPGLYIGTRSIIRLHAFLGGYAAGMGRVRFTARDVEHFQKFHDWVAYRLGVGESTSGWCNMILDKSANDADAFDRFFVLLDEFRNDGKKSLK
jgi:hypothetical protein